MVNVNYLKSLLMLFAMFLLIKVCTPSEVTLFLQKAREKLANNKRNFLELIIGKLKMTESLEQKNLDDKLQKNSSFTLNGTKILWLYIPNNNYSNLLLLYFCIGESNKQP